MQWIAREMDVTLKLTVLLCIVLNCNGSSLRKQLEHIARRFNLPEDPIILGAPSYPRHLPEAEPILPGHTLLRPAVGMLKSAVKFPHKDLENGAGVYGNINSLGLRYDGRNERVMYSGFRRMPTDFLMVIPKEESRLEELSELRQSTKYGSQPRNAIKKLIKIFPVKPLNKRPAKYLPDQRQHLILLQPIIDPKAHIPNNKNMKVIYEADFSLDDKSLKDVPRVSYDSYHDVLSRVQRSLDSRLHTSAKTLSFTQKLLEKLRGTQKRRQQDIIVEKPLSYKGGGLDQSIEETYSLDPEKPEKDKISLLHGKDFFNHIKFNPDAPDLEDYLPADFAAGNTHDLKNWWYYHEYDFQPFDEQDE